MTTIAATMIKHSKHAITGKEIATLLLRYPRWIHAEGRTHRQIDLLDGWSLSAPTPSLMEDDNLSRNASSSRAIPVKKLIDDVLADPAVPLFWGKNQKGMQASEECNERVYIYNPADIHDETLSREDAWLRAMHNAVEMAQSFAAAGYHKQIVNRLLEPFSHITVVVTATEWSNFFALRDHPDAEPHIAMLAGEMKAEFAVSTPKLLNPGDWHLPFVDPDDLPRDLPEFIGKALLAGERDISPAIKLSVARCASTSYKTVDGFDMTLDRAIDLHDKLVSAVPLHASPCEHQAYADEQAYDGGQNPYPHGYKNEHLHGNFVGWCQYRKTLPGECQ